jgi:hypothetical protein
MSIPINGVFDKDEKLLDNFTYKQTNFAALSGGWWLALSEIRAENPLQDR